MGTKRRYRQTAKKPVSRAAIDRLTTVQNPKTWPELRRERENQPPSRPAS